MPWYYFSSKFPVFNVESNCFVGPRKKSLNREMEGATMKVPVLFTIKFCLFSKIIIEYSLV